MRIGIGFDAHRFKQGRDLILGGVKIEHPMGLDGHSDADVLAHAMIDALLGAANLGDIGSHFPDNDASYAGIDSMKLLQRAVKLIHDAGYRTGNIDTVIIAQQPKLKPFIPGMSLRLAQVMDLDANQVSVKATTTEAMGFTGRKEGIAAVAVALLELKDAQ